MDDLDRRLLAVLRADSRTPAAAAAKALGVSRGTVQNRIARLQSDGVILGFTVRVGEEAGVQRVRAIMCIEIEGGRSASVMRGLRGIPEVSVVHTTNGRWDMLAELDARDLEAFSLALDQIRGIGGIGSTETSLLLRTTRL